MALELIRVGVTDTGGVQGILRHDRRVFAVTLEDPWRGNQTNVSCIPTGSYTCKRIVSPHFGETFEVTGVLHRTHILFHKGNTTEDTHGCILVAEKFVGNTIQDSAWGFREFMSVMTGQQEFELVIYAERRSTP